MVCFIYFCDLYSSQNIIRVVKSRIMRWVGHVVLCGQERCILGWWEDLRERDNLKDLGKDERIIKKNLQDIRFGGLD